MILGTFLLLNTLLYYVLIYLIARKNKLNEKKIL